MASKRLKIGLAISLIAVFAFSTMVYANMSTGENVNDSDSGSSKDWNWFPFLDIGNEGSEGGCNSGEHSKNHDYPPS